MKNIPACHGYSFTREKTRWAIFSDRECCGQIFYICSWAIPAKVYESLELPAHLDLYLSSKGQWTSNLEEAAHELIHGESPKEFIARGAVLRFFVGEWARKNNRVNPWRDYRVYQICAGTWGAEEVRPKG